MTSERRSPPATAASVLRALAVVAVMGALAGCGSAGAGGAAATPKPHPQVVEPVAGQQPDAVSPSDPVGDVHARPPTLADVHRELREEHLAATVNGVRYINPLRYVTVWERTDQGVDAALPAGAPILAPGTVKILAVIPDWYLGQPLVYFELLDGPQAGSVQYVAEQITDIATPGSMLVQGQTIARFATRGTGIEYGWSTLDGVTLARATTGYEEGEATPAGRSMRRWLNSLGAGAGPG
ncbi:MAG: hypothetical protein ACRDL5_11920 [Solirubrobacteraceae bacterium]